MTRLGQRCAHIIAWFAGGLVLLNSAAPAEQTEPLDVRSPKWWLAQAAERAGHLPESRSRWIVLRNIAEAQADRRDLEALERTIALMPKTLPASPDGQGDPALAAEMIAVLRAMAKGPEAFVEQVEKIEDEERREDVLESWLDRQEDVTRDFDATERAYRHAKRTDVKSDLLRALLKRHPRREPARMVRLIEEIPEPRTRNWKYLSLIGADTGGFPTYVAVPRDITADVLRRVEAGLNESADKDQAYLRAQVANYYHLIGDADGYRRNIAAAVELLGRRPAGSDEEKMDRARALKDIVELQSRCGDFRGAADTIARLGGGAWQAAIAQAKAGRLDEALATARGVADEKQRSGALAGIAVVRAERGEIVPALDLAREITLLEKRGEALAAGVDAHIRAGDLDSASSIAPDIEDQTLHDEAWADIAMAHAERNQPVLAETVAARIKGEGTGVLGVTPRQRAYRAACDAWLRARHFPGALAAAQRIPTGKFASRPRQTALQAVADAQRKAGIPHAAVATLTRMKDAVKGHAAHNDDFAQVSREVFDAQLALGDWEAASQTADECARVTKGVRFPRATQMYVRLAAHRRAAGDAAGYQQFIDSAMNSAAGASLAEVARVGNYLDIAHVQFSLGDIGGFDRSMQQALKAADEMGDVFFFGPSAYAQVAAAYLRADRLDELPGLFDRFRHPVQRAMAYSVVALMLESTARQR